MKNVVERPMPGYLVLKPYEMERKVGGWHVTNPDAENAPALGTVTMVGPDIEKMPYATEYLPKVGDIIAYKKYNAFKLDLGGEVLAVHFTNVLMVLKEDE